MVIHIGKYFFHKFSMYVENLWKDWIQDRKLLKYKGLPNEAKGTEEICQTFYVLLSVYPCVFHTVFHKTGAFFHGTGCGKRGKRFFKHFLMEFSSSYQAVFRQRGGECVRMNLQNSKKGSIDHE